MKFSKQLFIIIIYLFIFIVSNYYEAKNIYALETVVNEKQVNTVPNQLIIKLNNDFKISDLENLLNRYGGNIIKEIPVTHEYLAKFCDVSEPKVLEQIKKDLKNNNMIKDVSFNFILENTSCAEVIVKADDEDIKLKQDWWITNTNADKAWNYKEYMSDVKVGIIDSMFDTNHEDLEFKKVFYNPDKVTDFHGTHVAGIIGAKHNDVGVNGISPNSILYGFSYDEYFDKNKYKKDIDIMSFKCGLVDLIINDVKVINVSLGNLNEFQFALEQGDLFAIQYNNKIIEQLEITLKELIRQGYDFLIVQSAGNASLKSYVKDKNSDFGYRCVENKDKDDDIFYTNWLDAKYTGLFSGIEDKELKNRIIVVGGNSFIDGKNQIYMFSQVGNRVDVLAPASNINSCVPGNRYKKLSGTSMAAAFVTAEAAMIWGIRPEFSGTDVKNIIKESATKTIKLGEYSYKVIDMENAVLQTLNY